MKKLNIILGLAWNLRTVLPYFFCKIVTCTHTQNISSAGRFPLLGFLNVGYTWVVSFEIIFRTLR